MLLHEPHRSRAPRALWSLKMSEHCQSILLIDDDLLLCRSLSRSLREKGFEIDLAHTAGEAMHAVTPLKHDLILLDWILPDRDGVALLRDLRDAGVTAPILMLTGQDGIAAKVHALGVGADDYLVKPLSVDELVARVVAHTRRPGMFSVLRIGRISLDAWKLEARVDDVRVDLTPLEFAVLAFLARHVEQAVSREQIFENAWKDKGDGNARVVDIQLTRLRRKLGAAAPQIETVRGSGFRLTSSPRNN